MSLLPVKCFARKTSGCSPFHIYYNSTTDELTININGTCTSDEYFKNCITINLNDIATYHRYEVIAIENNMMFMDFTETSGNSAIGSPFIDKFYYSIMNKELNDIVLFKTNAEIFIMSRYPVILVDNCIQQTMANASYNSIVRDNTNDINARQKFLDESARIDKQIYYEQWFHNWDRIDIIDAQLDAVTKLLKLFINKFTAEKTKLQNENSVLYTLVDQCCQGDKDIDTAVPGIVQQGLLDEYKSSHRSWQRGFNNMNVAPLSENSPSYGKHPLDEYAFDADKFYSKDSIL